MQGPQTMNPKMAAMQKQMAVSKSASKQSKKNLLNYDTSDAVQVNPYLLEINKANSGFAQ